MFLMSWSSGFAMQILHCPTISRVKMKFKLVCKVSRSKLTPLKVDKTICFVELKEKVKLIQRMQLWFEGYFQFILVHSLI